MRISDWSSDVCSSDISRAARIALYKLSRRPFFRPGFGRGVAEIVRLIHDEAAEFILIGMFFLRRLFLFRFEVPIQIAGFDPIEQAVPSTTVPIAGYMVEADRKSTRLNSSP